MLQKENIYCVSQKSASIRYSGERAFQILAKSARSMKISSTAKHIFINEFSQRDMRFCSERGGLDVALVATEGEVLRVELPADEPVLLLPHQRPEPLHGRRRAALHLRGFFICGMCFAAENTLSPLINESKTNLLRRNSKII